MLKNLVLLIVMLITLINVEANSDIIKLNKGQEAPFTGALFSEDKLNELRINDEKRIILEKQNVTLRTLGEINEQKLELYQKDINNLHTDLTKAKIEKDLVRGIYFIAGALIMGAAFKIAQEAQ